MDVLLQMDSDCQLTTQLYDQRDDFNFSIINFPYSCIKSPDSPAYGVYIFQLIRYARASSAYDQLANQDRLLTNKLMPQGFAIFRLDAECYINY